MAVWELFSKREQKQKKQGQQEVFQYDNLPKPFRVQVIHIWADALGRWRDTRYVPIPHAPNGWWGEIFEVITREKGLFCLSELGNDACAQCRSYLMSAQTEDALDLIEVSFWFVDNEIRRMGPYDRERWQLVNPDQAISELNHRFSEHGIGYEFVAGKIIRRDSQFLHAEAVKPALELLYGGGKEFSGPLQEFLGAHERYRKNENKDAIGWALKSLESTLKAICTVRGWAFDPQKDAANKLLEIVFAHDLVPGYLQSHFGALRAVLESGVRTVRNKTSGHGQGATPVSVPGHLVAHVLHLAAANIVFLINAIRL